MSECWCVFFRASSALVPRFQPWDSEYLATAKGFMLLRNTSSHSDRCLGKTHHAAFLLSLEHSIAISAWPSVQTGNKRMEDKERRKEGKGRTITHLTVIHTWAVHGSAVPDLACWTQMHKRGEFLFWHSFCVARWLWSHMLVKRFFCYSLWVWMLVPLAEIISGLIHGLHFVCIKLWPQI